MTSHTYQAEKLLPFCPVMSLHAFKYLQLYKSVSILICNILKIMLEHSSYSHRHHIWVLVSIHILHKAFLYKNNMTDSMVRWYGPEIKASRHISHQLVSQWLLNKFLGRSWWESKILVRLHCFQSKSEWAKLKQGSSVSILCDQMSFN
jgi:hypothetical protein